MTERTKKRIRSCCIVALVLCTLWAAFEVLYFIGILTSWGVVNEKVDWSTNSEVKELFFILFLISTMALIGLCYKIVLNIHKGLRELVVFPQNNTKLLLWLALSDFIYMLCWTNLPLLFQDEFSFCFAGSNLITPFFLLFFAFMYKVAADAVEENNLTV